VNKQNKGKKKKKKACLHSAFPMNLRVVTGVFMDEPESPKKRRADADSDADNDDNEVEQNDAEKDGSQPVSAPADGAESNKKKKKRTKTDTPATSLQLKFPLSRVRQILQLDEELGKFRKESIMLIAKATELFVAHLTEQALHNTELAGRKLLKPEDIEKAIQEIDTLEFLRGRLDAQ
jgi:histone H3/H4